MLGKELNSEIYQQIVKNSILRELTFEEVIESAVKLDKFWEYAGAYYRLDNSKTPIIVIDREQSVGGYNNSELTLTVLNDKIYSNSDNFKNALYARIVKKQQNTQNKIDSEDVLSK